MGNRSLKQTANSLSSCEAEFYAASACAGELQGLAELFKELHYKVSVRLEMDSDSARLILQRRGPGGLKHIEIRCLSIQQWIREIQKAAPELEAYMVRGKGDVFLGVRCGQGRNVNDCQTVGLERSTPKDVPCQRSPDCKGRSVIDLETSRISV